MGTIEGQDRKRILIVEDVENISKIISRSIEDDSMDIHFAQDGEECLAQLDSFKPDLVILDLMLPKIHGLDILRRIKSDPATNHIGVIICSAKGFKTEIDQAKEMGAYGFLAKPFEGIEIKDMVSEYFVNRYKEPVAEAIQQLPASAEVQAFQPARAV